MQPHYYYSISRLKRNLLFCDTIKILRLAKITGKHNMNNRYLFFSKNYLMLELEKFELTVKYYYELGLMKAVDYEYVLSTLKMIKAFLNSHIASESGVNHTGQKWNEYTKPYRRYKNRFRFNPRQLTLFEFKNPIPIKGEIKVAGLNESLEALKPKQIEQIGSKFPHKIPAGTHWNQVIIKFLDDEQVEIFVKKLKHITTYKEMGLVGKGNVPEPSEQWIFLKVLAQYNGEISIKDTEAKDTYKQQKHLLSETLKNYFSIDFDPFYPYKSSSEKSGNSYKIKLTLIPSVPSIQKPNIDKVEDDKFGIKEYLDENAPSVIDY